MGARHACERPCPGLPARRTAALAGYDEIQHINQLLTSDGAGLETIAASGCVPLDLEQSATIGEAVSEADGSDSDSADAHSAFIIAGCIRRSRRSGAGNEAVVIGSHSCARGRWWEHRR